MDQEINKISEVQFSVLSPERILKMSVAHINSATLYNSDNEPRFGGLFDMRMGVIERHLKCKTCQQTYVKCPGHMGHIELAKPVYYIQFMSQVRSIFKCICFRCSKLLLNKDSPIVKAILEETVGDYEKRFNKIKKLIKNVKVCGKGKEGDITYIENGCGAIQPSRYFNNGLDFLNVEYVDIKNKQKTKVIQVIMADIAIEILKRISKEDALIMGFHEDWCLPHWLICSVLPVAPPSVRPSVKLYNNQRSEDDLTQKYNDIIKNNNQLKEKLLKNDVQEDLIKYYINLIMFHVTTLVDNDVKGLSFSISRTGRALKTIKQRLHGKEGRIRTNLMGKRVDFSARSVISPDPNIEIDQLGVPIKVAMNLTYPEIVNKYNINEMYNLIKNGNKIYPGAKSYKNTRENITKYLEFTKEQIKLEYGDIVYRHLKDDDYVIFNRQPSLHKMSMMGHRIKVMKGSTFRLNINVCKPYNADFDGDEMNMHVPQSIQSAIEVKYITNVTKQIISPSSNQPIITPAQDNLLGLYKITDDDVFFTRREVMNLLVDITSFDGRLPEPEIDRGKYKRWTGKQIISITLPNINIEKGKLKIKNGIVISGQINKSVSNKIVQSIFREYGFKKTSEYLNNSQRIITKYFVKSGFSVGISDVIIHPDIKKENEKIIIQAKEDIINLDKQLHLNIFDASLYEPKTLSILQKTTSKVEESLLKSIDKSNRINYIIKSGSKGNSTNISQMTTLLGQQIVSGERIGLSFEDRSLPHYCKFVNSIEERGYITSSFIDGLTPQEFFFHAMTGREGLIDTAVKTANSGYVQRKLVKSIEDLKANHDYTIKTSNNDIIQFIYGDDAFNPIYLEEDSLNLHLLDNQSVITNYILNINDDWDNYIIKKNLTKMAKDKNTPKIFEGFNKRLSEIIDSIHNIYSLYIGESTKNVPPEINLLIPINFDRLISNTIEHYNIKNNKTDITPIDIINTINEIMEECQFNNIKNPLMEAFYYDKLSPNILIKQKHINKVGLSYLKNQIISSYKKALVEGGEMVGPIAAQSIGEISTQLTLNTFHYAGVGEKSNVTSGVNRLVELLSKQKPKEAQMKVFFTKNMRTDKDKIENIKHNIEFIRINDVIESTAIYLENKNNYEHVLDEDKSIMQIYEVFSTLDSQYKNVQNNPWVIKLDFNKRKMLNKKINMDDIDMILKAHYENATTVFSDDNANKLIFRIKLNFKVHHTNVTDNIDYLIELIEDIKNIIIKGIKGVRSCFVSNNYNIFEKDNYTYKLGQEYFITTNGSNLFDILCKKYVDSNRTYSTDINEAYDIFGIEGARYMIEQQINEVFKFAGAHTSPRHIALLCDKMCSRGSIMAINRHGINASNIGPLAKSSFEETIDQLKSAGIFGMIDHLEGVSANIMVGQIPKCGTGDSEIIIDEEKLQTMSEKIEEVQEDDSLMNEMLNADQVVAEDMFNLDNIDGDNIEF
jgi:DNA-directed RNA polymerase II subunit RPB1